ncbi:CDP-alcohol phosphatidyltransferase family protein [Actinomadura parmotrematis]|uniref:CDP-alcohol phosphatidyltransferase family protein n=1 Tax=Actinomadura parmotrematis TaxID=2864039 RepID=A0ABS7FW43_9ACTN|nr:CDP-alcohol phosphatidyltransferase family protein [Actinomadura parmotrematis]MBW8484654.1 CDP-alcohol phosphatidyltransferase family protein [Actinomadura parmotrematis]
MTVAVIIATGTARGGPEPGPAAVLPGAPGDDPPTLLTRLCRRLTALNVPDRHIVTRPEHAPLLRKDGHDVIECADPAADLREIARLARLTRGPLLLLPGDLATGGELLARLVRDARTTVTAVTAADAGAGAAPVRRARGTVVSAGSAFHQVTGPDAAFPGVLRVGRPRFETLAETAERLAGLLEAPGALPEPAGEGEPDPLALLLVGLVRAGVPVTALDAGGLPCLRADDEPAAQAASAAVDGVDERAVRLKAAVKSNDGFFTTFAVSSWSPYLVRLAAWRGLSPNTVTCLSMGLAVIAAVWFAAGTRTGMVAGAALFYLSFVFDCVDGQLARYTRQFSVLGAWLDAVFDRAKEYTVFAGLAVGSTAAAAGSGVDGGDVWPLAVAALCLQTVRHMIDFSFGVRPARAAAAAPAGVPLGVAGDGAAARAETAPAAGRGGAVARLSAATSRVRALHWLKKMVVFPIGERFALISITAALFDARVTFVALLAWGAVGGAYTLTGRVLRTLPR